MRRRSFLLAGTGVIVAAGASACTVDPPTPSASATPEPDDLLVPRPTAVFRSAWATDPYHLGSLSYLTVGATAETRAALAVPVIDRVFLAGEATSVDSPATVDGATASGERAAADVITVGSDGERVAVIGAGIAGATAARRLLDAGFRVTVLEASDRTGGRIHSTGDDDWGVPVELGADRFAAGGATDTALRDLDVETGLISTNDSADGTPADGLDAGSAGGAEYRSADGTPLEPSAVGTSTIDAAAASLAGSPNDISFAAAIRQVQLSAATPSPVAPDGSEQPAPTDGDWVDAAVDADIRIPYGAEPTDLSARSGLADGPRGGDSRAVTALSQLVDDALDGVDVWSSNVVSELAYDADGVSIRIATGESLQVDRVVVTVSLGVLKSGDIRFSPALPLEHSVAIAGLGMGAAEVVWLRFETAFWRSDATSWTTVGSDVDITRWRNLEPATGVPVLVGYVGGSDAVAFAGMDDDEIVERARRSLEPYLGQ